MTDFWKRKLAAYLHDPPSKCLDIATHGDRSDAAFRGAGFVDTEVGQYSAHADHTAAAADRLPFPKSQVASVSCAFDGVRNAFLHPLSGVKLPFHAEFKSSEQVEELEHAVQPVLSADSLAALANEHERWRARYFAHWRLWPKHATEKDYRMAFLPADTRIPDHSIWTHMELVSALGGCAEAEKLKPAFLKFQLGPVQDFIAAARSIRDLWSGSYLLSWLMAAGMKALSAKVGPDAVIFPTLRGQPLFDLHWREDLWGKVKIGGKTVWEDSIDRDEQEFLTPNLPNVFLAVVPAGHAADLARDVAAAIQIEWQCIADAVWGRCQQAGLTADEGEFTEAQRMMRFDAQVKRFLSLSWQVTPWPDTLEAALKLAEGFAEGMPIEAARIRAEAVVAMAEKHMPMDHRDGRYYIGGPNGPKAKLNNIGLGWSIILALNSWELDAVRQTRAFGAASPGGWQVGTFSNKDALTGREEAMAGGKTWGGIARGKLDGPWKSLFKHDDWISAPTLIKRVWHFAYLAQPPWNLKTSSRHFPMPDTRSIARHDPFAWDDGADNEDAMEQDTSENYFAVLAFDGDGIGQWVSGEKTPPFSSQLADYTDHEGKVRQGALEYFERDSDPDGKGNLKDRFAPFLASQRPLSPSYHLQFSEALSNFALQCARPVVEAFDGRLIYAGGDDVVALLPADTALPCAQALRMAFQGDPVIKDRLRLEAAGLRDRHVAKQNLDSMAPPPPYHQKLAAEGCLLHAERQGFLQRLDQVDQQNRPIPFLVPGPKADCSVGIAIDPATGTTGQGEAAGKIYSARYLRLRDAWRLGVFAKTDEKDGASGRVDIVRDLLKQPHQLLVGGQQRLCTATRCEVGSLPIPRGKTNGFGDYDQGGRKRWLVKWILLSPAVWPQISDKQPDGTPIIDRNGRPIEFHCGGWLPNWIRQEHGQVMLRSGKRQLRSYIGKHARGFGDGSEPISAKLVAAIVPKPVPVTGWALPNDMDRAQGGAKSTHLAVPAGAVYYFEAEPDRDGGPGNAIALAAALNWHGSDKSEIRNPKSEIIMNRRSTLMGEKGFGLGVCGTWDFFPGAPNAHR